MLKCHRLGALATCSGFSDCFKLAGSSGFFEFSSESGGRPFSPALLWPAAAESPSCGVIESLGVSEACGPFVKWLSSSSSDESSVISAMAAAWFSAAN